MYLKKKKICKILRRIKTGFLLSWFDNNHVILLLVNAPVCVRAQVFEKGVWPHVWVPLCAVLCRADVYFVLKGKLFLLSLYKHERSQGSDDLVVSYACTWFLKNDLKVIFKSLIGKKYIFWGIRINELRKSVVKNCIISSNRYGGLILHVS